MFRKTIIYTMLFIVLSLILTITACRSNKFNNQESSSTQTDEEIEDNTLKGPFHDPWTVMPTIELPAIRNWVVKRGIIHTHSPYSHDACDDEPFIDDIRNEQCFEDCRFGMCDTLQDFVFLTDHDHLFADYEYPDVLLYKEGDSLIIRNGLPVANRINCTNGHSVIVAAGTESSMMPIGLEHHVSEDIEERHTIYRTLSEEAVRSFQEAGALVFLQHTEGWEMETILGLPIDGIEMYNLHQNLMNNKSKVFEMVLDLEINPENLPEMELLLIGMFQENEADLYLWSMSVMKRQMPAVLATDSHRNVFSGTSLDGERIDSFRRMMHWFSNYVLVPPGEINDDTIKNAIKRGRMYGAFDYLGYPVGFDFHARVGSTVFEMGDRIDVGQQVELFVSLPSIYRLDPGGPSPIISLRILKANNGEWEEVAADNADLSITVNAGVYRAEARIVPEHLRSWLGPKADTYITDYIWIYSNPIYVGTTY